MSIAVLVSMLDTPEVRTQAEAVGVHFVDFAVTCNVCERAILVAQEDVKELAKRPDSGSALLICMGCATKLFPGKKMDVFVGAESFPGAAEEMSKFPIAELGL